MLVTNGRHLNPGGGPNNAVQGHGEAPYRHHESYTEQGRSQFYQPNQKAPGRARGAVPGYVRPDMISYGSYGVSQWQENTLTGNHVSPPYIPPGVIITGKQSQGRGGLQPRNLPGNENSWADDAYFGAEVMASYG